MGWRNIRGPYNGCIYHSYWEWRIDQHRLTHCGNYQDHFNTCIYSVLTIQIYSFPEVDFWPNPSTIHTLKWNPASCWNYSTHIGILSNSVCIYIYTHYNIWYIYIYIYMSPFKPSFASQRGGWWTQVWSLGTVGAPLVFPLTDDFTSKVVGLNI